MKNLFICSLDQLFKGVLLLIYYGIVIYKVNNPWLMESTTSVHGRVKVILEPESIVSAFLTVENLCYQFF
jgi:hypothetical protein